MLLCNKIVPGMDKKVNYLDYKSNKTFFLPLNLTSTFGSLCLKGRLLSRAGTGTNGIELLARSSANLGAKFINTDQRNIRGITKS